MDGEFERAPCAHEETVSGYDYTRLMWYEKCLTCGLTTWTTAPPRGNREN